MGEFLYSVTTELGMFATFSLLVALLVILPSSPIEGTLDAAELADRITFTCANRDVQLKIKCVLILNKNTCAAGRVVSFAGLPSGTQSTYTDSNVGCRALRVEAKVGKYKGKWGRYGCSEDVPLLHNQTFFEVISSSGNSCTFNNFGQNDSE